MIYFDNASSTYIHPDVLTTYQELLTNYFANPSGSHQYAQVVNELVNKTKQQVTTLFKYPQGKVIFTSGATEANNLALKGLYAFYKARGKKIIISAGEHKSISEAALYLAQNEGADVVIIPLLPDGTIDLSHLAQAVDEETIIVSVIAVNNENGAINPLAKIKELLRPFPKALFHSDVTQAVGKITLDYDLLDAFSFSAHKLHGLKGSGALLLRKHLKLMPLFHGGGQEEGFRSGTNNAPTNIVLAKTLRLVLTTLDENKKKVAALATSFKAFLAEHPHLFTLNSLDENPYIVNFSLVKHKASVFQNALSDKEIYVSIQSSCNDKTDSFSSVIYAQTGDKKRARETLRLSFNSANTLEEVEIIKQQLLKLCEEIKDGY